MFLLLPIVYLLVFKYYPMLGAQIAFKKFTSVDGIWGSRWVGLTNFTKFFTSYQFSRVIKNTLSLSFYSLLAGFPLPIILALMLNSLRSDRFRKTVETITYIPHFISTVVLVSMIIQVLNPHLGIYGNIYRMITGSNASDMMGNPNAFPHLYVWSGIWQSAGWNTIIYTAALSGVDLELHEAAQIDGASRFQRIFYVDIPCILPTATIMLILNAGNIMSVGFEKVYLMQNNLNVSTSEIISTYVYKVGLTGASDFSYASAIGLFNSIINMILLVTVNAVTRKMSETSLW